MIFKRIINFFHEFYKSCKYSSTPRKCGVLEYLHLLILKVRFLNYQILDEGAKKLTEGLLATVHSIASFGTLGQNWLSMETSPIIPEEM